MKHNGFTLIELMIVVAIVGILASVAFPAYQKHALMERCKSNFGAKPLECENLNIPAPFPTSSTSGQQCVLGLAFYNGKQVIGANGNGVACK